MASADAFEQVVRIEFGRVLDCILAQHHLALEEREKSLQTCKVEKPVQQEKSALGEEPPGSLSVHDARHTESLMISRESGTCVGRWSEDVLTTDAGAKHHSIDNGGLLRQPPHRVSLAIPRRVMVEPTMTGSSSTGSTETGHFAVLAHWKSPLMGDIKPSRTKAISMTSHMLGAELNPFMDQLSDGPVRRIMMPPSSMQYLFWGIVSFACVAYDIITIPLQILSPGESTFTFTMSLVTRIFWNLDIFASFLTGYVSPDGAVEMRPSKVAWQYLRTWFFMDLLLVGCDWVEAMIATIEGKAAVLKVLGMLRAIRLVRIVRLMQQQKLSEFIFEHIRSEGVRISAYIVSVLTVLLCLVHVITCLWHGIRGAGAAAQASGGAPSLAEQYFLSFHHMLALFSGEQILEPRNLPERMFIIVVLIFAFVVSGAFVGSLTSAMTQLIANKRSEQFAALSHYLSDCDISRTLAARVHRNARHALSEQGRHTQESSIELMALISDPLKAEIHYEVYSPTLVTHPFFRLYDRRNPVGMRHICHNAVSPLSVSRGDVVFSEYEVPVVPRMFFVISGQLKYVQATQTPEDVEAKEWVAEAVLWTHWAHRGTLQAFTECRLLSLDADRMAKIISTSRTRHGADYASKFVEHLNRITKNWELTDMSAGFDQVRDMAIGVFVKLDKRFDLPFEWHAKHARRRNSSRFLGDWVSSKMSLRSSRTNFSEVTPAGIAEHD